MKTAILSSFVLVSVLMIILSSCGLIEKFEEALSDTPQEEEILNYMEEKYNEPFLYERTVRNGREGYSDSYVLPEAHKEDYAYEVRVRKYKTGEMLDSYPNILFRDSARVLLEEIARDVFGECVSEAGYNIDEVVSADIGKESSPLEFLRAGTFACDFATTYDASRKEEITEAFIDALKEKGILIEFRILFVTPSAYEDILENPEDAMSKYYFEAIEGERTDVLAIGEFVVIEDGEHMSGTWR